MLEVDDYDSRPTEHLVELKMWRGICSASDLFPPTRGFIFCSAIHYVVAGCRGGC